jgi:hypothetical protein
MKYKLGKSPASPPRGLRFADVFNAEMLPTPPKIFGHAALMAGIDWGMLGNDSVGDCTIAGAMHETMLWTRLGGAMARFTAKDALDDYAAISGYNGTSASDTGCDVQDVAAYRQKIGVRDATGARHKIQGAVSLQVGNLLQLRQAAYIFDAAGIGVQLPASAQGQFEAGQVWSVVKSDAIEGGHYIPYFGVNSAGENVVNTWSKNQGAPDDWLTAYVDEAWAYLSIEMLNAKGISPEAYDVAALTKYLGEF